MPPTNERQATDEVIRETRRIKEALAESMGFDMDRILEDARQKQKDSGRKVVPPPVREDA